MAASGEAAVGILRGDRLQGRTDGQTQLSRVRAAVRRRWLLSWLQVSSTGVKAGE